MFERFTNRARHVVVLAQEEARLLNHNYIGTEHILLGLLGEPESIAGTVLGRLRVHPRRRPRGGGAQRSAGARRRPAATSRSRRGRRRPWNCRCARPWRSAQLHRHRAHPARPDPRGRGSRRTDPVASTPTCAEIRAAVLEAVSAMAASAEAAEGETADETNAVLRWLRHRLTRHSASVPFRPEALTARRGLTRGTPAVEAALQQAARLAGPLPVGSHHLLLAALDDTDSAASSALASLGVDLDELRAKLRSAQLAGHHATSCPSRPAAARWPSRSPTRSLTHRAHRPGHRRGGQGGAARRQRAAPGRKPSEAAGR